MKKKTTTDAVKILHRRFYKGEPARSASLESERINAGIAREICALRIKSGLTQKALANMVGTTPSAISRLEDADYPGHSLSMLQRIASALNRRVQVKFIPNRIRANRSTPA
jgi:DNA-binding XRE family transcriptional regulator